MKLIATRCFLNEKARLAIRPATALLLALLAGAVFPRQPLSAAEADPSTAPAVAVAKVTREDLFEPVTVSAEFRPYLQVVLHAKVSGFVSKMNVDIGDEVKSGQLLATLEVPELAAELANARAVVAKAEADYTNAHLMYTRLVSVNKDHANLVAQQELDSALANDLTTAAAITAAQANVVRYQSMVAYTQITAPFDGVITHRYADPGALIQAGTSSDTQSLPLVRVSDNYHLRLDFPVSVDYVKDIHLGDPVEIKVASLNNQTLTGAISRFTHDVDDNTRTMISEVEVPNPGLELIPGMYAEVILKLHKKSDALAVPTEAVVTGKSPVVYVVKTDHRVDVRNVTLGLETPDKYEIVAGLQWGEMVMIGNHSEFQAGQLVEPKIIAEPVAEN